MTDLENINNNHAALKATMLLVLTVLSATLQSIGMLLAKDVLLVNQDTLGTILLTNVHVVNCQEPSSESTVSAHHQRPNGMMPPRPVHAHQIHSVTTVFHVQPQEFGTMEPTPVNAHHQQTSGTEPNAFAQLAGMAHHVLNAQLQDTGTFKPINVFAKNLSSGMEANAFAHNHFSCTKEDVLGAQTDTLGKTTNVKLAHAHSRICKSLEPESDTFIHFIVQITLFCLILFEKDYH
jgi:hypothetical protein